MIKDYFSLSNRLPLAVLGILLVGNLLLGTVLYSQLSEMSGSHQETVGNSLAYQLAYSVKTPMLHRDALSLQVAASQIAGQPGVARVAIFDQMDQLLTEKAEALQKAKGLVPYRAEIVIDNTVVGSAQVELIKNYFWQQGLSLFKLVLAILLLCSLLVLAICWHLNNNLVQRIAVLIKKLPDHGGQVIIANGDELSELEQRIMPWLTVQKVKVPQDLDEEKFSTFVSLRCGNFSRLKEQLSNTHFTELLSELNQLQARVLKLYSGELISFVDNTLVLQFTGNTQDDDYPVRALYAAYALIKQLTKWRSTKGLELELTAVLGSYTIKTTTNQLMSKLLIDEYQAQLEKLQDLAKVGDVLMDKETGTHLALDHIALLEPASSDLTLFRCEGLELTADTLVERQLAVLGA